MRFPRSADPASLDPIASDSGWSSAREPVDTLPIVVARNASSSKRAVNKLAPVLALATLVAGCAKTDFPTTSPFDLLGPLVNAPISAPISASGVRLDDGAATPPELHDNPRALEGLDLPSQVLAQRNLAYALEQGRAACRRLLGEPRQSGRSSRGRGDRHAGVDARGRSPVPRDADRDGMEGEQSDKRLLTYCRSEAGWLIAD